LRKTACCEKKEEKIDMTLFGQIIIGPPGVGKKFDVDLVYKLYLLCSYFVGKTTYCHGMQQITEQIERRCAIINLDFANDGLPYTPAIDVRDFITLQVSKRLNRMCVLSLTFFFLRM
jgi:hypothetical protein